MVNHPNRSIRATTPQDGFDLAVKAIIAGEAKARALWVILSEPTARDGLWLRPMPWEGAGEYQAVEYADGRAGFVRLPDHGPFFSLQHATKRRLSRA